MKVQIEVIDDLQGQSLASIREWIVADKDVRPLLLDTSPYASGEMGGALEAVELFLREPETVTAVSAVIVAWMSSRIGKTRIRVRSGEREIEIDSNNPKKAHEIAEEIRRTLDAGE